MNYKIVEIDVRDDLSKNTINFSVPLTYRIAIKIEGNAELTLSREYFYYGYNDGEKIDGFYFNSELSWSTTLAITRATFLTRNFDSKYLKQKEQELIELFYNKLIKSENKLKIELYNQNKILGERIEEYQELQKNNLFIKIIRKQKLESLK
jgi:hypothetical protein